jgi:hypothetical protein
MTPGHSRRGTYPCDSCRAAKAKGGRRKTAHPDVATSCFSRRDETLELRAKSKPNYAQSLWFLHNDAWSQKVSRSCPSAATSRHVLAHCTSICLGGPTVVSETERIAMREKFMVPFTRLSRLVRVLPRRGIILGGCAAQPQVEALRLYRHAAPETGSRAAGTARSRSGVEGQVADIWGRLVV